MKKLMLVSLFAVLLTPFLSAQEKARDGYWWKSLNENQQTFFVAGYIEGMTTAFDHLGFIEDIGNPNKDTKASIKVVRDAIDYFGIYTGQLRDGVTSFYADYRNQSLKVITALMYARDQIKGKPQDELDRWLTWQRSEAAKPTSETKK